MTASRVLLLFLFLASHTAIHSQETAVPDDSVRVLFTTEELIDIHYDSLQVQDSLLVDFAQYDPIYARARFYLHTSVYGSPAFPLQYEMPGQQFELGFNQWDLYRTTRQNIRYYNTFTPYTRLYYVQGGGTNLQILEALHTRNINPGWNVGLKIRGGGSEGYYQQQSTASTEIALFNNFQTKNQRYRLLANVIVNRYRTQENGGIINPLISDSGSSKFGQPLFDTLSAFDKINMNVNLGSASQQWRETQLFAKQYYYFGKYKSIFSPADSLTRKKLFPSFYLSHAFQYRQTKHQYEDEAPDSAFYRHIYDNPLATSDSIFFSELRNEFTLSSAPYRAVRDTDSVTVFRERPWLLAFTVSHAYNEVGSSSLEFATNQLQVQGRFHFRLERLRVKTHASLHTAGYLSGNYHGEAQAQYPVYKNWNLMAGISAAQTSVPFIFQYYSSNHYRWLQELQRVNHQRLFGGFVNAKENAALTAEFMRIGNYPYFDSTEIPVQANEAIPYLKLKLQKVFKTKHFVMDNVLLYQPVLSNDLLRLPDFLINTTLAFDQIIKDKFHIQVGVILNYNTAYKAARYLPPISQLALQDSITVGNYPHFDVFFNAEITRFRIFAKLEHANQEFTGSSYFYLPNYPLKPRNFVFGLAWEFVN
ncbi:MAG: putative porin [Bacteroidia bacterium]